MKPRVAANMQLVRIKISVIITFLFAGLLGLDRELGRRERLAARGAAVAVRGHYVLYGLEHLHRVDALAALAAHNVHGHGPLAGGGA